MQNEIFSGLVGAIVGQLILIFCQWRKASSDYSTLLVLIAAECRYNLDILEELRNGVVNHRGSFKRLSVQFLEKARERIPTTNNCAGLVRRLTAACIDMDVYNRELSYVFNGEEQAHLVMGTFEGKPIVLRAEPERKNISQTINGATEGVRGSLTALLEWVEGRGAR